MELIRAFEERSKFYDEMNAKLSEDSDFPPRVNFIDHELENHMVTLLDYVIDPASFGTKGGGLAGYYLYEGARGITEEDGTKWDLSTWDGLYDYVQHLEDIDK